MSLYSHYDHAHNHPVNRGLHMLAIPTGFSALFVVWFHPVVAALLVMAAFISLLTVPSATLVGALEAADP